MWTSEINEDWSKSSLRQDLQSQFLFFFFFRREKACYLQFFLDVTGVDASIYKARTFSATDAQGAPFVSSFIFFYILPLHLSTLPPTPSNAKKALTIIGTFSIWIDGVNFTPRMADLSTAPLFSCFFYALLRWTVKYTDRNGSPKHISHKGFS